MSRATNIKNAINELRYEKIQPFLKTPLSDEDQSYLVQYDYIAQHFNQFRDKPAYDDFVIGSHIVYAWMPRVLRCKKHEDEGKQNVLLDILSNARHEGLGNATAIAPSELRLLSAPFSGSLVAPSKFLHFLNPDAWPMWDSRVYRGIMKLAGKETSVYHYEMQNVDTYITYVNKLRCLANSIETFDENHLPPELKSATKIRCLEFALFMAGKK